MSFEMPSTGGKSKTEEKSQQPGGFVVQVSGSTTNSPGMAAANKLKQQEHHHRHGTNGGAPIEITSKLNGDASGDGLVSFDNAANSGVTGNQGVMTVATIKPTQKQISETTVLQMNNIQRSSVVSSEQHRPVLTKQKQKIISSQDRPKVFAPAHKNTNNLNSRDPGNKPQNELLHRHQMEQPPRNQTSCNNRTTANHHQSTEKSGN